MGVRLTGSTLENLLGTVFFLSRAVAKFVNFQLRQGLLS
jgi:hypothetical protein